MPSSHPAFASISPIAFSPRSTPHLSPLRPRMVATSRDAPSTPARTSGVVDKSYDLERRAVGSSGLILTEVALGTMTWGQQNSEAEAHAQLDFGYERGIVGIDAAEMYPVPPTAEKSGTTERYIASWLRERGGEAFRDKVVIASKVAGSAGGGRAFPWIRGEDRCLDDANITAAVDGILERLGTDYIDLLQVHWPDRYVPMFGASEYDASQERECVGFLEQLEAMDKLVKTGKVRNIGLSNETAWGVAQFASLAAQHGLAKPISVQNSYSLIHRDFEGHMSEACAPCNGDMPLLAYSPLAGGALTGKYLRGNVSKNARFALYPNYMKRFQTSLACEAISLYEEVAMEAGLTLTQLSLAWCKSRSFVRSTIIGATSLKQLEKNVDSFSIKLDDSTIEAVNRIYARYRDPSRTT